MPPYAYQPLFSSEHCDQSTILKDWSRWGWWLFVYKLSAHGVMKNTFLQDFSASVIFCIYCTQLVALQIAFNIEEQLCEHLLAAEGPLSQGVNCIMHLTYMLWGCGSFLNWLIKLSACKRRTEQLKLCRWQTLYNRQYFSFVKNINLWTSNKIPSVICCHY